MTIQFLQELIEKNTRVILPEFGAFLVKDDGTGVFKPENVTFSPFLRFNDGVLEEALTKGKGISKDDAEKQIAAFVEEIKTSLLNDSSFKIGTFGYLYRDKRGSVHFSTTEHKTEIQGQASQDSEQPEAAKKEEKPAEKLLNVSEEVPETSVTPTKPIEPAKTTEPAKPIVSEKKAEPIKPQAKKPIHKPIPPQKHKPIAPKPEKQKGSSESSAGKAILIGVLVGVVFIALIITGWYLYSNDFFSSTENVVTDIELNEPTTNVETNLTADSSDVSAEIKSDLEKEFVETAAPAETEVKPIVKEEPKNPVVTEAVQPQVKVIPSTGGSYHVIVGSFRNTEFADKFSNDLKKSGYSSTVVVQPSGMHAVTLGSYQTREEATNAMVQFRSQHPNAWILKQ